jgi:hypothetical protein
MPRTSRNSKSRPSQHPIRGPEYLRKAKRRGRLLRKTWINRSLIT